MAVGCSVPNPIAVRIVGEHRRSITVVMTAVGTPSACSRDGALTWVGEEQHVEKDHAEDRLEGDPHR
jgi:hypothetical protein